MPPFVAVSAVVVVEVAVGGSGGDVRSCIRTISEAYELSCKPDPDICLRACWPRYILWTSVYSLDLRVQSNGRSIERCLRRLLEATMPLKKKSI